jgi:hypothetical protein
MKINTSMKAIAAAVTFAVAGAANAAIDGSADGHNNVGGTELVLTIFNASSNKSESFDLFSGSNTLGWNDFSDLGSYSFDASSSTLLGVGGTTWNVMAVDSDTTGTGTDASTYGTKVMTTVNNAGGTINNTLLAQSAGFGQDYVNALNNQPGHAVSIPDGADSSTGGASYWGLQMNSQFMPGFGGTTAAVGGEMSFLLAEETFASVLEVVPGTVYSPQGEGVALNPFAGTWSLDSTGTLSYSAVSTVPVPAAVWLLGSALIGLVGVSRRRGSVEA